MSKKKKDPSLLNPFFELNVLLPGKIRDEINILVIGETGVGKSTWINGIANYMSFNTFKDALNTKKPICLIPMNFSLYTGDEYRKVNVNVEANVGSGKGNSEDCSGSGQSCTQKPKVYRFETKSKVFNFIDTPGIGDTRGMEQDQENVRMIMSCLSKWDRIHLICILLKPNESRLRLSLRYCLEELLVNLHKNSVPNMAFVFTNSCNTLYRPGDTMTVLSKLFEDVKVANQSLVKLTDDNVFCMDNEAIRMMFAHSHGVEFQKQQIKTFSKSWNHTLKESFRLFQFGAGANPHSVAETTATWHVRNMLFELAKILVEMKDGITQLQKVKDEKTKELSLRKLELSKRQSECVRDVVHLRKVSLPYPNVVCNSHKCIETHRNPETNQPETVFKQVCCRACDVPDVTPLLSPAWNLRNCVVFRNTGNCNVCGCSWQCHMQIRFSQMKSIGSVIDKQKWDHIEAQKSQIAFHQVDGVPLNEIKLQQSQYDIILKLSGPYCKFLKKYSVIYINTAFEEYISVSIEELEKSIRPGENRSVIISLKKLLVAYQQMKCLFAIQSTSSQNITQENCQETISKLRRHPFICSRLQNSEHDQRGFEIEHEIVMYSPKMPHNSADNSSEKLPSSETLLKYGQTESELCPNGLSKTVLKAGSYEQSLAAPPNSVQVQMNSLHNPIPPNFKLPCAVFEDAIKGITKAENRQSGVNLYISNLDPWIKNKDLKKLFDKFGEIISVKVIYGSGKRFGFVCFKRSEDAMAAISEMNGKMVNSNRLHVSIATKSRQN